MLPVFRVQMRCYLELRRIQHELVSIYSIMSISGILAQHTEVSYPLSQKK